MEKAVIDRFEEGFAVLLIGEDERQINHPRGKLPPGAREGHWLRIEIDGECVTHIEIDENETSRARERIAGKLARLRNRGKHP